jgi:hypothetical protein
VSDQFPPPTGSPVVVVAPTGGTPKVIVWAFILSLAGFLILTALAAVAMVLTNWKKVQESGKGKGLAIAALVISGLWMVVVALGTLAPQYLIPRSDSPLANMDSFELRARSAMTFRYENDCFRALGGSPQYRYKEAPKQGGLRQGFIYVLVGDKQLVFAVRESPISDVGAILTIPHNDFTVRQLALVGC